MKPSANYVLVRYGKIQTKPAGLPNYHEGVKDLRALSDEKLADLGWYPVEYQCPTCQRHIEMVVDEKRRVVVVKQKDNVFELTKQELEFSAYNLKMDFLQGGGFLSDCSEVERIYYADVINITAMQSAVLSGARLLLFCRSEAQPNGEWVWHDPEELKILMADYVQAVNNTALAGKMVLTQVQAAKTMEDLSTIRLEFPQLPEWARNAGRGAR